MRSCYRLYPPRVSWSLALTVGSNYRPGLRPFPLDPTMSFLLPIPSSPAYFSTHALRHPPLSIEYIRSSPKIFVPTLAVFLPVHIVGDCPSQAGLSAFFRNNRETWLRHSSVSQSERSKARQEKRRREVSCLASVVPRAVGIIQKQAQWLSMCNCRRPSASRA